MTRPIANARRSPPRALFVAATIAVGLSFSGEARAERFEIGSEVSEATLYPQGAAVTRVARFSAPAGRHEIVLDDLPVRIDADSLRVAGASRGDGEGFRIEGISHRIDGGAPSPLPEGERAALLEQLRALEWRRHAADQEIARAEARRSYMEALRRATTTVDAERPDGARPMLLDSVEQWTTAWALIDDEVAGADEAMRDASQRIEDLDEEIDALMRRLDERPPQPPRGVATISIDAAEPIDDGVVEITYLTQEASWSPLYDLRLTRTPSIDADAPPTQSLALIRRAAIQQATGEDWTEVTLTLSTARPTGRVDAQEPPMVQALLVNPVDLARRKSDRMLRAAPSAAIEALSIDEEAIAGLAADAAPTAQAVEPQVRRAARELGALARYSGETVTYELPQSVDAPGDGSVRQVQIDASVQDVALTIRATPSVDATAFLYAGFANGASPLLPGLAAIYRDGVYLGRIELDFVAPGDEAQLPFGPYDSVVVSRVVTRTLEGDEGVFRVSTKRRHRFRLTAKNLGDETVSVTLYDAAPFTETDQIDVNVIATPSPTERDVDGRRGVMAWTFDLAGGAEETIGFGYDLSWPEGEDMILR